MTGWGLALIAPILRANLLHPDLCDLPSLSQTDSGLYFLPLLPTIPLRASSPNLMMAMGSVPFQESAMMHSSGQKKTQGMEPNWPLCPRDLHMQMRQTKALLLEIPGKVDLPRDVPPSPLLNRLSQLL